MPRHAIPKTRSASAKREEAERIVMHPTETEATEAGKIGALYIVSLPIGNPGDISLRALQTLRSVALVVAEDTQIARRLLDSHGISTPLVSLRPRRALPAANALRNALLTGQDAALVSDAGTPAIADTGHALIRLALRLNAKINAVPGPVAALAALTVSGLPADRFAFEGFPPGEPIARTAFFRVLACETRTLLLYESPARLRSTLRALQQVFGPDCAVAVVCDVTKSTERVFRGTLAGSLKHFKNTLSAAEITLVVAKSDP